MHSYTHLHHHLSARMSMSINLILNPLRLSRRCLSLSLFPSRSLPLPLTRSRAYPPSLYATLDRPPTNLRFCFN